MERTAAPILSIVIVAIDNIEETTNCLASIAMNPIAISYEIILVDNSQSAPISPLLQKRFGAVKLVRIQTSQGFSKNYNLGIHHSSGQYIMILNNDTIVHPGAIDSLVNFMLTHPTYSMVGPLLVSENGKVQPVCARNIMSYWDFILEQLVFDLGMPLGKLRNRILIQKLERRGSGCVPCISGACMLTQRIVLERVGLLDEGYHFYFEDIEWCRRMQDFGYKVGFVKEAVVTHLGDRSLSKVRFWAKQSEYLGAMRYFSQVESFPTWKKRLLKWGVMTGYLERWMAFTLLGWFGKPHPYARVYQELLRWIVHLDAHSKMDEFQSR